MRQGGSEYNREGANRGFRELAGIWWYPAYPWAYFIYANPPASLYVPFQQGYQDNKYYYWPYSHNTIIGPTKHYNIFLCIKLVNQKYEYTLWAVWTQGHFLNVDILYRTKYQGPFSMNQIYQSMLFLKQVFYCKNSIYFKTQIISLKS